MVTWTTCALYVFLCPPTSQLSCLVAVDAASGSFANCLQLLTVAVSPDDTGQNTGTSCLVEWYVLRISVPLFWMSFSLKKCTVHWWWHLCPPVRLRCDCPVDSFTTTKLIFVCPFWMLFALFLTDCLCWWCGLVWCSLKRSHTLIAALHFANWSVRMVHHI